MLCDIRQGRLSHPIKHGTLGAAEFLNLGHSGELNANFRPFGKFFNVRLESGYQTQVIEYGRA